jgi:hypothetical protein
MTLSITHIDLHNFRGIRGDLSWQFHKQPGFYFVQGQNLKEPTLGANGAGKSTIFVDGPYWILTGKTILSQRPGNSIEPWGSDKEVVGGALALVINDQNYVIRRGRNPSVLTINQRTVEQSEIDRLIPLSESALRRTLLLGQRSLMFLDLRPEEKSRLFSETLDLDVWLRAADLAGEQLRNQEREATKIDNSLSSVDGSMTEIRKQHADAIDKEREFIQQHSIRLAEATTRARDEASEHDELKDALGSAQAHLNQFALSGTPEDELRIRRSQEQTVRNSATMLDIELSSLSAMSSKLEKQIAAYKNSKLCPECGQPITDEHAHTRKTALITEFDSNYERINAITLESSTIEQYLGKLAKEIKALEENNKQFMELKLHTTMLEQQVTAKGQVFIRAMQDIKKIENETNPYSAMCDELEDRYHKLSEQWDALIEQQNTINGEIEILKFWQKGYRDIRLQQIDTTLLELELATNRNAAALGLQNWEIQFATERETKSGSTSHVFSIFLFPPGQDKPIPWESYSGGEAQRWQLAVTFGLSEVLMSRAGINPDIEILDEPTGFLSQEGIDDLLECLHARAHELQRRIYLIDHRSLERGSFDGIVTVIKDDAGIHIEH